MANQGNVEGEKMKAAGEEILEVLRKHFDWFNCREKCIRMIVEEEPYYTEIRCTFASPDKLSPRLLKKILKKLEG